MIVLLTKKKKIINFIYLHFSGSRFALMEIKAIVYYLLQNFSIEPSQNTEIPLKLKKVPFGIRSEKGLYLNFKIRNK